MYHTSGPSDSDGDCYWEHDKDFDGTIDSIITNEISSGPQTVKIAPSDAAFKTSGCAPWTKVG